MSCTLLGLYYKEALSTVESMWKCGMCYALKKYEKEVDQLDTFE